MAKIFVVDDDAIVRSIVVQFLQFDGHITTQFATGPELLDHMSSERPDLVITDFSMPVMSGLELREAIGEIAPSIPCVVMTGHLMDETIRSAFDAVLEKPLGCREMLDLVRELTQDHIAA